MTSAVQIANSDAADFVTLGRFGPSARRPPWLCVICRGSDLDIDAGFGGGLGIRRIDLSDEGNRTIAAPRFGIAERRGSTRDFLVCGREQFVPDTRLAARAKNACGVEERRLGEPEFRVDVMAR